MRTYGNNEDKKKPSLTRVEFDKDNVDVATTKKTTKSMRRKVFVKRLGSQILESSAGVWKCLERYISPIMATGEWLGRRGGNVGDSLMS